MLCLGALLFAPQFTEDLVGLAYGAWRKHSPSTSVAVLRFTSPDLEPLLLYEGGTPRSNGPIFTTYVNDGVALLERETTPSETILKHGHEPTRFPTRCSAGRRAEEFCRPPITTILAMNTGLPTTASLATPIS